MDSEAVKSRSKKRGYHHGNLRAAIMEEGLRLLENGEVISLRQIARNVGVKAPSVYRHFPNKEALLKEFAAEGLKRLTELQTVPSAKSGREGLAISGRAYVRFAVQNPALYRLIYSALPSVAELGKPFDSDTPSALLLENISKVVGDSASEKQQFAAAIRGWSLVHGLAMLILDEHIDPEIADELIDQVITADALNYD